ncbi:histidine kinase dimerization/phosphoacceptor domain -containing protein [Albirhodobacter sp. R86504]|uniref:histidine kinase dimerization/phosphoacceptor domain -containing protein n=1 Tax=Albirhodobacter sp. R86504 TaxID=3093848 RepID=UPI0036719A52
MKAENHPENSRRVEALRSYGILDTDRERDFDDVVALASKICETPVSLISLVDEDRQWMKATVGVEWTETTMDRAICAHAILSDGYIEVNDTTKDPRTADNPLVTGPENARFYAGSTLLTPDGLPLGTLCVLDTKPRKLTDLQREALQVLSRQVMAQLEMRRALAAAETLRHEVDHRVKNSLQSLSALAGIKARVARSEEARHALGQIQKRIHTVAMLHEQLYKTDAGAMVDLGKYIENITNYLGAQAPTNVSLQCKAEKVSVPSDQAAAVGTFINEFVANSLKHAFPEGRAGKIALSLVLDDEGHAVVTAEDNGIGLPEDGEPRSDAAAMGLGMQIMQATASQLGGALDVIRLSQGLMTRIGFRPSIR